MIDMNPSGAEIATARLADCHGIRIVGPSPSRQSFRLFMRKYRLARRTSSGRGAARRGRVGSERLWRLEYIQGVSQQRGDHALRDGHGDDE